MTPTSMTLQYEESNMVIEGNPDSYTIGGFINRNDTLYCVGSTFVQKSNLSTPDELIKIILYGEDQNKRGMRIGEEIIIMIIINDAMNCESTLIAEYATGSNNTFIAASTSTIISFQQNFVNLQYPITETCIEADKKLHPTNNLPPNIPYYYSPNNNHISIDTNTGIIDPTKSAIGQYNILIQIKGSPSYCYQNIIATVKITEEKITDFSNYINNTSNEVCEEMGGIEWNLANFPSPIRSISYNNEVIAYNQESYTKLTSGNYQINIIDTMGCTTYANESIEIKHVGNCEEFILFIGQQGPQAIHFNYDGELKIYDKYGKLVKTLDSPTYWEGTTDSGALVDFGIYFVQYESGEMKTIKVYR